MRFGVVEYFSNALGVSSATLSSVSLVCAIGLLFLKERLPHPPIAYICWPIAVLIALLALHGLNVWEIYTPQVTQQWLLFTVLSATFGTGVTLLAYIVLFSLFGNAHAERITGVPKVRHIRLGN